MISASFNFSRDDALALAWHYYSASRTVQKARLWGQFTCPLVMIWIAAMNFYQDPGQGRLSVFLLVVAVVWALFYPRYYNSHLLRTAAKMFKETSYQKTFGPCSIALDDDGIVSSSQVGEGKYNWSSVDRVLLTHHHLFIFLAGPHGYAIPRNQVPDTTIQQMKEFAEGKIPRTESVTRPIAGSDNALR